MTPQEALITLYKATQQLQLKAEDHETLKQCALLIEKTITPKEEIEQDPPKIVVTNPLAGTGKKGSK